MRSFLEVQPFSENLFSREKLPREIRRFLHVNKSTLQKANKSTLILYGMSGVGKTQIARKYCEIYCNFYKNFVWIDAAIGKLRTSMRNQCQILGFDVYDSKGDYLNIEVIVEKIHDHYKNEKTLYIFDNVDDESVKNLTMYISRKPNSFTLVTSQWRAWSNNVNKILVDVFTSEEAFAYVKNNIKENADENIRNLIKELGYHPFAITQAIKYINIHRISIEKYVDRYRSKPEILDNNFPTEEEPKSAIKAINLVLIKLEKSKSFPFKILNCLSHCDYQNISKQFIIQISKQMEINEEYVIDEAVGLLMSYSLLNFDDKKYSMHELTQLTCRCFQNRNSTTNTYLSLIENLFIFELIEVKDHMDYGNYLVFHFICMFRTNGIKISKTFHNMTTSIKKLLLCKGLFEEAIEILISIQSFNTETYGENNKFTLDTKDNIATCLKAMGKYNEALEIHYSVDKIQTKILGINHPDTMRTKHNIAICFYYMGKYNVALEIHYSVDKIRTEILGINHPDTMGTKHNIAICFYYMGKYNEALEIHYSVDKIRTEILGINHPDTMGTKNNIANCLDAMGKYNEALEIHYSVDKIKTEILGINHPDTMSTKNNIANCLYYMGKYNEALEIYYSVDKIQTEILGINHPYTMRTKNNIALCLKEMGKYNEALEIYYSVDKIQTEILGSNSDTGDDQIIKPVCKMKAFPIKSLFSFVSDANKYFCMMCPENEINKLEIESKIISITTDNAEDIKKAMGSIALRLSCICHNLNHFLNHGTKLWTKLSHKLLDSTADVDEDLIYYNNYNESDIESNGNISSDDQEKIPCTYGKVDVSSDDEECSEEEEEATDETVDQLFIFSSSILFKLRKAIALVKRTSVLQSFVFSEIKKQGLELKNLSSDFMYVGTQHVIDSSIDLQFHVSPEVLVKRKNGFAKLATLCGFNLCEKKHLKQNIKEELSFFNYTIKAKAWKFDEFWYENDIQC
ncbi:uncharacterized protein LOC136084179 [Hydra vulgaris]|uniref:Uncharacterized protein LOC136084179 n=1 Tax=Hydra vulgaris TaxID=6087 RepID=A0ABM4CF94_HYDVU